MRISRTASRPGRTARRVAATLVVLAVLAGFEGFVAHGAFDGRTDPVTSSVLARP